MKFKDIKNGWEISDYDEIIGYLEYINDIYYFIQSVNRETEEREMRQILDFITDYKKSKK